MIRTYTEHELENMKSSELREIILSMQEDILEMRIMHQSASQQNMYQKDMLRDFALREQKYEQEISQLRATVAKQLSGSVSSSTSVNSHSSQSQQLSNPKNNRTRAEILSKNKNSFCLDNLSQVSSEEEEEEEEKQQNLSYSSSSTSSSLNPTAKTSSKGKQNNNNFNHKISSNARNFILESEDIILVDPDQSDEGDDQHKRKTKHQSNNQINGKQIPQSHSQVNNKNDLKKIMSSLYAFPDLNSLDNPKKPNQQQQKLETNKNKQEKNPAERAGSQLFEDFLIISGTISELKALAARSNTMGTVQPSVVFAYPDQIASTQPAQLHSIKAFCYPYDVHFKSIKPTQIRDVLQTQIFTNHSTTNQSLSHVSPFVFQMLGNSNQPPLADEDANDLRNSNANQHFTRINSNQSLYCIAITVDTFINHNTYESGGQTSTNSAYLMPMTLCFLTYYPFIEFFHSVIQQITQLLKNERVQQYLQFTSNESVMNANASRGCLEPTIEQMLLLDIEFDVHTLKNVDNSSKRYFNSGSTVVVNLMKALGDLQRTAPMVRPNFELSFKLHGVMQNVFRLPEYSRLLYIDVESCAEATMRQFAMEEFMLTLCGVCFEKKVVFFSKNITKLTSAILTFVSLLKPFVYVMPLVYVLPSNIEELLDSPMPLVVGINSSISYIAELTRKRYQFDDKLVVDLDAVAASTQEIKAATQVRIHSNDSAQLDSLKKNLPNFKESLSNSGIDVFRAYFKVNNRISSTMKTYHSYRKKFDSEQSVNGVVSGDVAGKGAYSNRLSNSNSNSVEDKQVNQNVVAFITAIRMWLDVTVLNHIPKRTNKKLFDSIFIESARNAVLSKSTSEKLFLSEFLKSQMFATYAEEASR